MERRCRKRWRSDRPQTCGLRARFPDCLSTHRFAGFDGQQSGRECIFPFRTDPQFSMVIPHLRTVPLLAARCSVAAHCASLRVLATPALRASAVRKAHLRCSLFHWGLRTGLRFAGPVFRGCGALRAVLAPPPLRGFDDYGLFPPLAAAFVRPFFLREKGGFWQGNFQR